MSDTDAPEPGPNERAFLKFHAEHPEVYAKLVDLARQWKHRRGRERISIGVLWEVTRWETALGDPEADYRLNNNYRPRYARLIMEQEPDLAGLFETRRMWVP